MRPKKERETVTEVMSACGVLCSGCAAYRGEAKGIALQKRGAEGWLRIYGRSERSEDMTCGGCVSSDAEVFHTSRTCKARLCCRSKGFSSCAECPEVDCPLLAKAQSVWDGVPEIAETLSLADFEAFARPYLDVRGRLARARRRAPR
jgi:hypothetical protein